MARRAHDGLASLRRLAADVGWNFAAEDQKATLSRERSALWATVSLEAPDQGLIYFGFRTTSWHFPGDRTDLHDVVSTGVSALVASRRETTFRLIDVANPALDIAGEIYARLLVPAQPTAPVFDLSPHPDSRLRHLLQVIGAAEEVVWWTLFSRPHSPADGDRAVENADASWTARVLAALGIQDDDPLTARRHLPNWTYYRSKREASIVENEELARTLMVEAPKMDVQRMREGVFVRFGALEHRIPTTTYRRACRALRQLGADESPVVIPLENRLVAVAGAFTVALPCDCGRASFDRGRRNALERLTDETALLLSAIEFSWQPTIPAGRFEALIHELLRVSRQVVWIRAVGSTNDRDRGRDFLARWIRARPDESLPDQVAPTDAIPVLVQCKVRGRTVGKADVTDIVDTVELNQASGYFLAVSTTLSSDLVDQLHRLRERKGWMIDWWGRSEIEDALRRHPYVASRYCDIVSASA